MTIRRWRTFVTRTERRELAVVLALFLIALLPRLFQIDAAPPGLNGDEVYNIIDARSIGWGNLPVFFPGNQGREALYFYLLALSTRLFGVTIWALRVPSVLLGSGAVVLAYIAGRDLFDRRAGLITAALIAVSFWPMMMARIGLRAISLTFMTTLTIVLLHRALQSGRPRHWLLGGVALGLTLYTYIPARLFPLVIAGWLVWVWWRRPQQVRRSARPLLLSMLLAVIIFAPFGVYMVRYPDRVNQRISSMTNALERAQAGEPEALVASIGGVLKMFSVEGDEEWRYHLAHEPVYDPLTSLFFYTGLALCLLRAFRTGEGRARQPEYALMLLWLGAMIAPNAVLNENPSFIRAAGAITPVYLMAGIGLHTALGWLQQRTRMPSWIAPLLIGAGLAATLARTTHDYFDVWVNHPQVRTVYHAQQALMGRYLAERSIAPETRIFMAYDYVYDRPTALSLSLFTGEEVTWFALENTFPWMEENDRQGEVWYFVPERHRLPPDGVAWLKAQGEEETVRFPEGAEAFTVYRLRQNTTAFTPEHEVAVAFEEGPHLTGYDIADTAFSGDSINVRLHWQIPREVSERVNRLTYVQIHLADASGVVRARAESLLGYPQAGWTAGDRFIQDVEIETPPGILPGPVSLSFGLRDVEGNPLGAMHEDEGESPMLIRSRPLDNFSVSPQMRLFDDTLVLAGASFRPLVIPGAALNVELNWVALQQPSEDYRVRLALYGTTSDDELLAQTFELLPDIYPPTRWRPEEPVTTLHGFRIPLSLETEETLLLRISLLPAAGAGGQPVAASGGSAVLGELEVDARSRIFEPPQLENEVNVQFGEAFRLIGYELDTSNAHVGGSVVLTLAWQAILTPDDNYTVFNHLLGEDGQSRGQFDSPPVGDAWLTETWLPGEVVVEERVIEIEPDAGPGEVQLIVGLYNADDLQRLPVMGTEGEDGDQFLLETFEVNAAMDGSQ